jgi:hypothetical protein
MLRMSSPPSPLPTLAAGQIRRLSSRVIGRVIISYVASPTVVHVYSDVMMLSSQSGCMEGAVFVSIP